jgi:DNA-directed RNA polymerase subunit RPC12/RpoP
MVIHSISKINKAIDNLHDNRFRPEFINSDYIDIAVDCMRSCILAKKDNNYGEWLLRTSTPDSLKCSICGNSYDRITTYCPNCGHRMRISTETKETFLRRKK